jgi:uncharacterized membrane protein YphA (DoxX/SURF4 family)
MMRQAAMHAGRRWWPLAARVFLGVVFLYASVDKVLHPAEFAQAVHRYQLLPDALINLCALVLPWLELLLAVCLIGGLWLPGAVLWANALLGLFFVALIFNYLRGLNIDCGCFSTTAEEGEAPMLWYLVRDAGFLAVAGWLWRHVTQGVRRPTPDHFPGTAGA